MSGITAETVITGDFGETARRLSIEFDLAAAKVEVARLRKSELDAVDFIRSVMDHRAECHAYDLDMGNPIRVFSDTEEWDRLEDQAAEFLTKRAVS